MNCILDDYSNIIEFLVKAKKETYAGKGAQTSSSRINSHDYIYLDGDYMYYDTYLGGNKFAGEEAVWIQNRPFWCMNYAGRVIGENFSGDFLKEALMNVPSNKPFRGPDCFLNGDYAYESTANGDFEWFQGCESIAFQGTIIYQCCFHGGIIE